MIYTYTFTFQPKSGTFAFPGRNIFVPRDKRYASLLLVCRQIYREACIIPFQINWFRIPIGSDGFNTSLLFSRSKSWQAKELRHVELIVSERALQLPLYLDLFNGLAGCKYLRIKIEGNLSKKPNMDMLSKLYGFQSIAPNLDHLRIVFEENDVCGESLENLEKDLKALLPKIHVILREQRGLNTERREQRWFDLETGHRLDVNGLLAIHGAA